MSKEIINNFRDKYDFLSNFYPKPIVINGVEYQTSEHYYQAMKAANGTDRKKIMDAETPGKAKTLAKNIEVRKEFRQNNLGIMMVALQAKFNPGSNEAQMLVDTGNQLLIEGNYWHDNFWGNCFCSKCVLIDGKNVLGKMLMIVRESLQ